MQIGWINNILLFDPTRFPRLAPFQKQWWFGIGIEVSQNKIDGQFLWNRHFQYCFLPAWSTHSLCRGLTLCLPQMRIKCYFCGDSGAFLKCLQWNGCGFLVPSGKEVEVVMRDKGGCLIMHGDSHQDSLHIISYIKYSFECLFGVCWLFILSNILPLSLYTVLTVVIMKPSGGENPFERYHSPDDVLTNRT